MSSADSYVFSARARGVMAEFASLTLCDGYLDTVLTGYGSVYGKLQGGLYKLILRLNDKVTEQYVELQRDTWMEVDTPETASSVVAEGFRNAYGYYGEQVREYTQVVTAELGFGAYAESVFLFFRYPSQEVFRELGVPGESLAANFLLLDAKRKVVCGLGRQEVRQELAAYGWMAFHARLAPGSYYLYYGGRKARKEWGEKEGQPAREIPVQVFPGWQTQGFMTFGRGPVFSSLTFSLASADITEQQEYTDLNDLQYLEGILQNFRNGIYYLPDDVLFNFAHDKFKNPVLGLLAAYAYFKSGKRDKEEFFGIVVENLNKLLGPFAPDTQALNVLAGSHFNRGWFAADIQAPCMLLAGLLELVQVSAEGYACIRPGSLVEKTVDKLFYDMVWTSYKPLSSFRDEEFLREQDELSRSSRHDYKVSRRKITDLMFPGTLDEGLKMLQMESRGPGKPRILNSWIANTLLFSLEKADSPVGLNELAAQLQVTPNMLSVTAKRIVSDQDKISSYLAGKEGLPAAQVFTRDNLEKVGYLVQSSGMDV